MTLLISLVTLVALGGPGRPVSATVVPADSIGVEIRGGQRFVKHRVAGGETLSAISRRYRVALGQLTAANPQIQNGLGVGQIVFVPRPPAGKATATTPAKATPTAPSAGAPAVPATYTVAKGETLFGIAQRYRLSVDDLMRLNKLPAGSGVRVGQQLVLTEAGAGAAPVAAAPKTAPVRPVEVENVPVPSPAATKAPVAPAPDKPAQIATVTPAPATEKEESKEKDREENNAPTRASEVLNRVVESGLGAPIDKSVTDKYLALHKTAPTGTIMQVKNNMNGLSVYVRVIGKLPDTGENNNVLVRLSPRAMQKLGTADSRFRVETNYIPQ